MRLSDLQQRLADLGEEPTAGRVTQGLELLMGQLSDADAQSCLEQAIDSQEPLSAELSAGLLSKVLPSVEEEGPQGGRFGPYRVIRELGRGGMGVVFEVEDPATGVHYALKVLPRLTPRARREGELLARLDHPFVVRIHSANFEAHPAYLVQERVSGRTLAERVDAEGPLPVAEALRIATQIGEGLAHAHGRDVLHRDLKPENVLLTPQGQPRLVDFGLARSLSEGSLRLTRTGASLGTPAYMAPEQVKGAGEDGPWTDVYGLGGMMYFALTGKTPFEVHGLGPFGLFVILRAVVHQSPLSPRELRPELPADVEAVVMACLAKKPQARPSLEALISDLERLLAGDRPKLGRSRRAWVGGAFVFALVAALGGGFVLREQWAASAAAEVWARETLDPFDLADPQGADLETLLPELQRRAARIQGTSAQAPRLHAFLRLAKHRAGEEVRLTPRGSKASSLALQVDAAIQIERGRSQAGVDLAKRAQELEDSPAVRLLVLRGLAQTQSLDLLCATLPSVAGLVGSERPAAVLRSILRPPLREAIRGALEELTSTGGRTTPRGARLELLVDRALETGLDLAPLASDKQAELERWAPAWEASLAGKTPAQVESALRRLHTLLVQSPRARAGPRLLAGTKWGLQGLCTKLPRRITGLRKPTLDVLACDGLASLVLGSEACLPSALVHGMVGNLPLASSRRDMRALVFVTSVRTDALLLHRLARLAREVPAAEIAFLEERWPRNAAVRLLIALKGGGPDLAHLSTRATGLSDALSLGQLPLLGRSLREGSRGLHPAVAGWAHLLIAARLAFRIRGGSPAPRADARRVLAHLERALERPEVRQRAPLRYEALHARAQAGIALGSDPHGVQTWRGAVPVLQRLKQRYTKLAGSTVNHKYATYARCDLALALGESGETEEGLQIARTVLAEAKEPELDARACMAVVAILGQAGREDEAWELARARLDHPPRSILLTLYLLRSCAQRGLRVEGCALAQRARTAWPRDAEVGRLAASLGVK
jgi:hypothetical protein